MLNNTISDREKSAAAVMPGPGNSPQPINVWLVDDNQPLRSPLREILDQCDGLRCQATFHSPNAVLSALASKTGPDVILLDIQMGEACGLDAIRPIKALSRSTQVLMLTTFFDSKSKKRALNDGASGFLLKHFSIEQIQASIKQASQNPAPHLKCSQRPSQDSATPHKPSAPRTDRQALPERKPASRPTGSLLGRFVWLKQCLDMMHLGRN